MSSRSSSTRNELILVDSDENCRRIFTAILEHRGYVVDVVSDCGAALEVLERTPASAVLLDPYAGNTETVAHLRDAAKRRQVPVVALTSRVTSDELQQLRGHDFDVILLKPVMPSEVADAVDTLVVQRRNHGLPGP